MSATGPKARFLLDTPLWRALGEALAASAILFTILILFRNSLRPDSLSQTLFFLVPLLAFWCAIRLRLPTGGWVRHALIEGGAALAVAGGLLAIWGTIGEALGLAEGFAVQVAGGLPAWLYFVGGGFMFLALRIGARLWLLVDRLQRQRLLWAITYNQVLVALLIVALGSIVTGLVVVSPRGDDGWDVVLFTLLPFAGVMAFMALIAVVAVLPPVLLAAHLSSRRTVRRIEALALAAANLRRGDYRARIQVTGEDEVAQLQADFNAMAADLERAMRELEAERDKVAALLQARRELVASVSHELRTPVATIRGYLDLLLDPARRGGEPAAWGRDLEIVQGETLRLQQLIDDLFALSQAEAQALRLELRPTDVAEVIRRRVEATASLAWQGGRVEIVAELPVELPFAMADEQRVDQIIANLLRNSLRHTPPGGIIAVSALVEGERLRLDVRDTGEGISPQDLPHIWERFYRGEAARAEDGRGAGLGLALVKELAEAMGGQVSVKSQPGEGSCFTVRLPLA